MSLFLQYQLGQAIGSMGEGSSAGAGAAATGFGLALGFMMPGLLLRAMVAPPPQLVPPATSPISGGHPTILQPHFCGRCGAPLGVTGARYCGQCGSPVLSQE